MKIPNSCVPAPLKMPLGWLERGDQELSNDILDVFLCAFVVEIQQTELLGSSQHDDMVLVVLHAQQSCAGTSTPKNPLRTAGAQNSTTENVSDKERTKPTHNGMHKGTVDQLMAAVLMPLASLNNRLTWCSQQEEWQHPAGCCCLASSTGWSVPQPSMFYSVR